MGSQAFVRMCPQDNNAAAKPTKFVILINVDIVICRWGNCNYPKADKNIKKYIFVRLYLSNDNILREHIDFCCFI